MLAATSLESARDQPATAVEGASRIEQGVEAAHPEVTRAFVEAPVDE